MGILAGFLPLITIGFTVKFVSHSLQQEIAQSLADLGAREGQHLEKQQHALINSQIRQKALDVAEDLARFIKLHPKPSLAAFLDDPEFRDLVVKPNTAEADAIMAKFSNLTPDIFAIEKAGVIFYGAKENKDWFAAGGKLAATSQRAADVWYDLKLIKSKPSVADLIDGSFLE